MPRVSYHRAAGQLRVETTQAPQAVSGCYKPFVGRSAAHHSSQPLRKKEHIPVGRVCPEPDAHRPGWAPMAALKPHLFPPQRMALPPCACPGFWLAAAASATVAAGNVLAETHPWVPELGLELSFRLDGLASLCADCDRHWGRRSPFTRATTLRMMPSGSLQPAALPFHGLHVGLAPFSDNLWASSASGGHEYHLLLADCLQDNFIVGVRRWAAGIHCDGAGGLAMLAGMIRGDRSPYFFHQRHSGSGAGRWAGRRIPT